MTDDSDCFGDLADYSREQLEALCNGLHDSVHELEADRVADVEVIASMAVTMADATRDLTELGWNPFARRAALRQVAARLASISMMAVLFIPGVAEVVAAIRTAAEKMDQEEKVASEFEDIVARYNDPSVGEG